MKFLAPIVLLALLGGVLSTELNLTAHMNCQPYADNAYWILNDLRMNNDTIQYLNEGKTQWIQWNMCDFMKTKCQGVDAYAGLFTKDEDGNETCTALTDREVYKNIDFNAINPLYPDAGIQYTFRNGSMVAANQTQSFTLNIVCNASLNSSLVVGSPVRNATNTAVTIQSPLGCPKMSPSILSHFIQRHKLIFFIVGFLIGTLVCFMGYRLAQPVLFLLGFCVAFLPLTYLLFALFVGVNTTPLVIYILLGIAVVLGILVGYIAYHMEKVGFFIVGSALALCITIPIDTAVLSHVDFSNTVLFGGCWLILSVIIGLCMVNNKDVILILSTSIFGSWLLVRSGFNVSGNYFNEFAMVDMVKLKIPIPTIYWIFLGIWFVVLSLGLYVQFKHKEVVEQERKAVPDYLEM